MSKPTGFIIYQGPSALDGAPIVAIAVTARSSNRKTGAMVQTYILRSDVPPIEAVRTGADASICGDCKHRGDGTGKGRSCYVTLAHGPSSVWRTFRAGKYPVMPLADSWELGSGRMVRLGTYGDPTAVPIGVWQSLVRDARGWTGYTHQWTRIGSELRSWQRLVMASCDSEAETAAAQFAGWRTFRVRSAAAPLMPNEVTCPASDEAGKRTTCAQCRLCAGTSARTSKTISIIAHGSGSSHFR